MLSKAIGPAINLLGHVFLSLMILCFYTQIYWSQPFVEYYMNEIHPDVTTCIGCWIVEPLGVYNYYSGVTTNQSEAFNTVLKRLQKWREAPLDSILFSLYQLQNYYFNEIQRGLCQSGDYKLSTHFANCARDPTEVKLTEFICPQDIVGRVQAEQVIHINNEFQPDEKTTDTSRDKHPSSQIARANLVLTENRISFDPKLGVFIVRNSEGNHNAVTLFPKQSCTCASTNECYHIISAKMSLRLHSKEVTSIINMTQLRKNTRSRKAKKSGRKKFTPAAADIVNPPPDSLKFANEVDSTSAFENSTSVDECECKKLAMQNYVG